MSSFGKDEEAHLQAEHLVGSARFLEASSHEGRLAFTLKTFKSGGEYASCSNLFVYESGGAVKQMTRLDSGGVSNPVFAPDVLGGCGAVMYLQGGQVRSLPLEGGESAPVTSFPLDIDSFKVFTGAYNTVYLACVMSVYPDKTPQETKDIDDANKKNVHSSGMVFDSLMVRHWDTWNCYNKRNHVFVCPLSVSASGHLSAGCDTNLVDLMKGLTSDCPPKPFGGAEEYAASPGGDAVVMTCRRVAESLNQPTDMSWSTEVSVFTVSIPEFKPKSSDNDSPVPRPVEDLSLISALDNHGTHTSPVYSPNGKFIAFLSMARSQYESDRLEITLYNCITKELSFPTRHIDISFGSIMFDHTAEGDTMSMFCTAQYRGSNRVYQVGIKEDGSFLSLAVIPGDESRSNPLIVMNRTGPHSLLFFESSLVSPNILKSTKLNGALFKFVDPALLHTENISGEVPFCVTTTSEIRSLRDIFCPCPEYVNGDLTMPKATQFYFPAQDEEGRQNLSELVHMMYLPPVQLQSAKAESSATTASFPLVLIIHGGPQGAIINSWHYRWNLSFYASKGYGVIAVNFHGSTGFGQKYVDSIRTDWGGQPFRDCMTGVETILAEKHYLDPDRVGALGASYGGYMINWINGHTDMFKCLVNHDGIFNLRTLYYATEELWFPEWEFGLPWVKVEGLESQYDKWNPETFVGNWRTPTLVIQGGKDYRVVETEGLSTFTALQRQGIPSQLLFFPDENHWCLKSANSLQWHNTVSAWLNKWLGGEK